MAGAARSAEPGALQLPHRCAPGGIVWPCLAWCGRWLQRRFPGCDVRKLRRQRPGWASVRCQRRSRAAPWAVVTGGASSPVPLCTEHCTRFLPDPVFFRNAPVCVLKCQGCCVCGRVREDILCCKHRPHKMHLFVHAHMPFFTAIY